MRPPPCVGRYGGLLLGQIPQQTVAAAQDRTGHDSSTGRLCGGPRCRQASRAAEWCRVLQSRRSWSGAAGIDSRPRQPSAYPPPQGTDFRVRRLQRVSTTVEGRHELGGASLLSARAVPCAVADSDSDDSPICAAVFPKLELMQRCTLQTHNWSIHSSHGCGFCVRCRLDSPRERCRLPHEFVAHLISHSRRSLL